MFNPELVDLEKFRKGRGIRRALATKRISELEILLAAVEIDVDKVKGNVDVLSTLCSELEDLDLKMQESLNDEAEALTDAEESMERRVIIKTIISKSELYVNRVNDEIASQRSNRSGGAESLQFEYRGNYRDQNANYNCKLPKLNLPTFSGDILKFQGFWDMFESAVHKKPHISEIEKFQYLRSSLTGDALKNIDGLPVTEEHYASAIRSLLETYQHPTKIIESHIDKLLNLEAPSYNYKSLSGFTSNVKSHLTSLEKYEIGLNCKGCSIILGNILANKLPDVFRSKLMWKKLPDTWTVEFIKKSLGDVLYVLSDQEKYRNISESQPLSSKININKQNNSGKSVKPGETVTKSGISYNLDHGPYSTLATTNSPYSNTNRAATPYCSFCRKQHWPQDCTTYITAKDRQQRARVFELCINCLSSRHETAKCTSQRTCRFCRGRHHTSLCNDQGSRPSQREPIRTSPIEMQDVASVPSAALSTFCIRGPEYGVALPTARLFINTEYGMVETRAVFDQCSQTTLILRTFANYLGLSPIRTIYTSINGINSCAPKQQYDVVCFNISTSTGVTSLEALSVSSMPEIVHTPGLSRTSSALRRRHINLADPYVGDTIRNLTILIGADQYSLFCDGNASIINGTNLIDTRFGKIIWGPLPYKGIASSTCTNMATVLHIGIDAPAEISVRQCIRDKDVIINSANYTQESMSRPGSVNFSDGESDENIDISLSESSSSRIKRSLYGRKREIGSQTSLLEKSRIDLSMSSFSPPNKFDKSSPTKYSHYYELLKLFAFVWRVIDYSRKWTNIHVFSTRETETSPPLRPRRKIITGLAPDSVKNGTSS